MVQSLECIHCGGIGRYNLSSHRYLNDVLQFDVVFDLSYTVRKQHFVLSFLSIYYPLPINQSSLVILTTPKFSFIDFDYFVLATYFSCFLNVYL